MAGGKHRFYLLCHLDWKSGVIFWKRESNHITSLNYLLLALKRKLSFWPGGHGPLRSESCPSHHAPFYSLALAFPGCLSEPSHRQGYIFPPSCLYRLPTNIPFPSLSAHHLYPPSCYSVFMVFSTCRGYIVYCFLCSIKVSALKKHAPYFFPRCSVNWHRCPVYICY